MSERVKIKRKPFIFCTYEHLMKRFKKQSYMMNKTVSRRIEEFIIQELEKEK